MLQVAIIGSGISGLSLLHHLRTKGVTQVQLFCADESLTENTPGVILGGSSDLFTRISSARGKEAAKKIWGFGNQAHTAIVEFCQQKGLSVTKGSRWHIAQEEMEAKELATANLQLSAAGFSCQINQPERGFTDRSIVLSELCEPDTSAVVDLPKVLEILSPGDFLHRQRITSVRPEASGVEIELASGELIRSEFVVLAAHLANALIYPYCRDWLVSYGDQWSLIEAEGIPAGAIGSSLTWRFGYNRISFINEQQVVLTGGRTMRKGAAIGVGKIEYRQDICDRLAAEVKKIIPEMKLGRHLQDVAALECRPCDELPLIGPIPGHERVLIATGYMGHGLSLGFFAGKCLTDFICHGRAPDLPDILTPRRLRSLSDS